MLHRLFIQRGFCSVPNIRRTPVARLVLCDDHPVVLDGLRRICEREFEIAAVATSSDRLLALLEVHDAECVLLDLGMPVRNGLETISALRRLRPSVRILIVTMHTTDASPRRV